MSLRQNASVLEYCRTSMSALSGCAAGILGLTGLQGFLFYFITAFVLSVSIFTRYQKCIIWKKFTQDWNITYTWVFLGSWTASLKNISHRDLFTNIINIWSSSSHSIFTRRRFEITCWSSCSVTFLYEPIKNCFLI